MITTVTENLEVGAVTMRERHTMVSFHFGPAGFAYAYRRPIVVAHGAGTTRVPDLTLSVRVAALVTLTAAFVIRRVLS